MKVLVLCVLAAALTANGAGILFPSERSYKILILHPYWARSHKNMMMVFAEALADRGHKVEVFTALADPPRHPNITEINYILPDINLDYTRMFDYINDNTGAFSMGKDIYPPIAREMYKMPVVKKLYERRKQFDLIIVNHLMSEIVYPFLHEVTFITVATNGMDQRQSAIFGNVLNPSYAPNVLTTYPFPMSLWHRFKNMIMHLYLPLYWNYWAVVPMIQKELSAHFPDLPPLLDIERNQSLSLINTHFSIDTPIPLLPSQVEVGAIHCRPAKPLPQDLDSWIEGADSTGVIYLSLGSVTPGNSIPAQYRQAFLEAFRRLPQRVLWKYEGELEGASDNIRISKWLPQQDVLGHRNVKVFISHGGLLSLQESIFHATPLLVLPIFSDQPRNAMFVNNSGVGRVLMWQEVTADKIVDALNDIITNSKYKENVVSMSASLKDQLTTPQERAIFWTEYVIRHKGAPQLRCPGAQLSWVEFLLLDVVGFLLLFLMVVMLLLYRLLKLVYATFIGRPSKIKSA